MGHIESENRPVRRRFAVGALLLAGGIGLSGCDREAVDGVGPEGCEYHFTGKKVSLDPAEKDQLIQGDTSAVAELLKPVSPEYETEEPHGIQVFTNRPLYADSGQMSPGEQQAWKVDDEVINIVLRKVTSEYNIFVNLQTDADMRPDVLALRGIAFNEQSCVDKLVADESVTAFGAVS